MTKLIEYLKCTQQCPEIEIDVTIPFVTFPCFFFNSIKSMYSKKTKWHTFSGFGPTSLSYNATAASYLLSPGFKPCNNIKSYIGEITP